MTLIHLTTAVDAHFVAAKEYDHDGYNGDGRNRWQSRLHNSSFLLLAKQVEGRLPSCLGQVGVHLMSAARYHFAKQTGW